MNQRFRVTGSYQVSSEFTPGPKAWTNEACSRWGPERLLRSRGSKQQASRHAIRSRLKFAAIIEYLKKV